MHWNIPNLLTWARIALIPLFAAIFYLPATWFPQAWVNLTATAIFAVAALTDWLDGYLARALNQTSSFGAFLDPVADKLMVAAALIVLVELGRVNGLIALVIVGREITISALCEWMAVIGQSKSVAVSLVGKIKTATQMVAILLLLYSDNVVQAIETKQVGTWLMYVAALLTLWSMAYYLKAALPVIAKMGGR